MLLNEIYLGKTLRTKKLKPRTKPFLHLFIYLSTDLSIYLSIIFIFLQVFIYCSVLPPLEILSRALVDPVDHLKHQTALGHLEG